MDAKHLREQVVRILPRHHAPGMVFRHDLHDVHVDGIARVAEAVRRVVLDRDHPVRHPHRRERVVIGRLIDGDRLQQAVAHAFAHRSRLRRAEAAELFERGDERRIRLCRRKLCNERLDARDVLGGHDVHIDQLDPAGVRLLHALQHEPVGRGIDVEPLRQRRRHALEAVHALAGEQLLARARLEANLRQARRLEAERRRPGDGRVGEPHHVVRIRNRVEDGHRLRVPHLRQPVLGRRQHLSDLELGRRLRPRDAPGPRLGTGRIAVEIRQPRHRLADLGRRQPRRPVEVALPGVVHVNRELAGAARPDLALAVAERRRGVLVPERLLQPRIVEEQQRLRTGQLAPDRADVGKGRISRVRRQHVEVAHLPDAVAVVRDEHTRRRDGSARSGVVQVAAQRPGDPAALPFLKERVLLVRIVADAVRVRLTVETWRMVRRDDSGLRVRRAGEVLETPDGPVPGAEHEVARVAHVGGAVRREIRSVAQDRQEEREPRLVADGPERGTSLEFVDAQRTVPGLDLVEDPHRCRRLAAAGLGAEPAFAERLAEPGRQIIRQFRRRRRGKAVAEREEAKLPVVPAEREIAPVVSRRALEFQPRRAYRRHELVADDVNRHQIRTVGRAKRQQRAILAEGGFVVGARPQHDRAGLTAKKLARRQFEPGVRAVEDEGGPVAERRLARAAEL